MGPAGIRGHQSGHPRRRPLRRTGRPAFDQEADDISQVITWAADQSWCSGRVGMLGVSYLALSQYKVAALNPPALKAICLGRGLPTRIATFSPPGGVVESGFARIWLFMTKKVARLNTDVAAERRKHPLRDEWWDTMTPDISRIRVPILVCTSFSDPTCTASVRCGPSRRPAPPSGMRTRIAHPSGPPSTARKPVAPSSRSSTGTSVRRTSPRFRRCGWRSETNSITLSRCGTSGSGRWHGPAGEAHLAPGGALTDQAGGAGRVTFDLRHNAAAFEYRFQEDTEVSGPMTLRLHMRTNGCTDREFSSASRSGPAARPSRSKGRTATVATGSPRAGSASRCANSTLSSAPPTSLSTPFTLCSPSGTTRRWRW